MYEERSLHSLGGLAYYGQAHKVAPMMSAIAYNFNDRLV